MPHEMSEALWEPPEKQVLIFLEPHHHISANQVDRVIAKCLNQPQPGSPAASPGPKLSAQV